MSMSDPHGEARPTTVETLNWLQDQLGQFKAQVGRVQQQHDQLQAAMLDVNEKLRDAEGRLREMTARTIGLPSMQEQMRQVSGLLERIQDAEVLIDTKFELLERTSHEERGRDQAEKNDLHKRLQDLERRVEGIGERQASVDEASRRYQEEVARAHIQAQQVNQRLETAESKVSRSIEALMRLEQGQADTDAAIRTLRRDDDALSERARLAHEVATRLETEMHAQQEQYRELPLLAERVELLRAERQRLEDRTSRAEESLEDARVRLEREEEFAQQLDVRMKAHDARLDHVHASTLDFRRVLSEQILKLNQMLERMKRRQAEELERDIKELRVQSNHLKNTDE
jgi:chromosome segregation ATPase